MKLKLFRKFKIVRFDNKGNCQFIYFNWRKFKFETTCWANGINNLFGINKEKEYIIIGIYN